MERNEHLTVMSFMPLGVLIVLTGIYAKNMRKSLFIFAPLLVGVAIVGGSRLNMMAYFIFLGFGTNDALRSPFRLAITADFVRLRATAMSLAKHPRETISRKVLFSSGVHLRIFPIGISVF